VESSFLLDDVAQSVQLLLGWKRMRVDQLTRGRMLGSRPLNLASRMAYCLKLQPQQLKQASTESQAKGKLLGRQVNNVRTQGKTKKRSR
jgi:hypothetical protein